VGIFMVTMRFPLAAVSFSDGEREYGHGLCYARPSLKPGRVLPGGSGS
jgi:hypothetical protein